MDWQTSLREGPDDAHNRSAKPPSQGSPHTTVLATSVRTGSVCWMTITGQSSHYRPCEASLMDRHWNIPMADYEWQAMNAEPRSRDHSPWTVYRSGLFTAHVPRPGIRRCGPAFAGRGEGRLPSSGDWQMQLFIGRARLCPSCGHLPSFADS